MTGNLSFYTEVIDAMSSIIRDYEYRVVECDDSYVRLDALNSSIQVFHDRPRAYEVIVTFSEQEHGVLLRRIPFNLGEVYREYGVSESMSCGFFQSPDLAKIREFMNATSGLLLQYCRPILRGDLDAFKTVEQRRNREAARYTLQLQMNPVLKEADEAWRKQNYEEFINLVERFKNDLSDLDKNKLAYALKKVT